MSRASSLARHSSYVSAVAAAALAVACMNRPSVVAVLHSPKQTHEVTLKVSATSPFHPMPYKVLTADGKSGSRALFADLVVYWGNGSDAPFHSPGSWPLESALRLAGRQGDTTGCDELVVRSQATQPVAFLHVLSRDVVLFMDVSAGELRVPVTPHRPMEPGWFSAQGRFADGKELSRANRTGPIVLAGTNYRYSVAITGTGLLLDISALSQGEPVGGCR
jgi:hypothetical protein